MDFFSSVSCSKIWFGLCFPVCTAVISIICLLVCSTDQGFYLTTEISTISDEDEDEEDLDIDMTVDEVEGVFEDLEKIMIVQVATVNIPLISLPRIGWRMYGS